VLLVLNQKSRSKNVIVGAGISGLSIGQLLRKEDEVIIFEGADRPRGFIIGDSIQGSLFHRPNGHVLNTKRNDVNDWF
jgi:protoporphyrinogen oxidase